MLKLIHIIFTYSDNDAGEQASSNCEDAVHISILFYKKVHQVKTDPCCADVWVFFVHADEG